MTIFGKFPTFLGTKLTLNPSIRQGFEGLDCVFVSIFGCEGVSLFGVSLYVSLCVCEALSLC